MEMRACHSKCAMVSPLLINARLTAEMTSFSREIAEELRRLANLAENSAVSQDYLLFRVDALTYRLFQLAAYMRAHTAEPSVLNNFKQVIV